MTGHKKTHREIYKMFNKVGEPTLGWKDVKMHHKLMRKKVVRIRVTQQTVSGSV